MNTKARASEQGGARLKFLIVATIIAAGVYAGYMFIPVAYQAYQLKDLMQNEVDTAAGMGKTPAWVKDQLVKNAADYGIPADATIEPQSLDNRMEVKVRFTKPIEFPGYVYLYEFDHTARSGTFLSTK
ncbi:MAG TPA: hypothetical protein VGN90_06960 [Pyrinomonadaceae bacterium]|jgi:hypothetical protein|nr:hypothetical protein [Pyrinomonadaceae bacterium]